MSLITLQDAPLTYIGDGRQGGGNERQGDVAVET